ncbi:MAG: hypothetical protein GX410_08300 [Elusimicrobia bacterium]|nr:hypothetical protein [Elusimicrobiota bacterium]
MTDTIFVDCPHCGQRLEVERKTGKVLKTWDKVEKKEGVDLVAETLKKRKEERAQLDKYFSGAQGDMKKHKEELLKKFDAEKKRIHEEGDYERPVNPMDLD